MKFCEDRWYSDEPLGEAFPTLFLIATVKDAWVAELWEQNGEGGRGGCWNSKFTRYIHDWEFREVGFFLGDCKCRCSVGI